MTCAASRLARNRRCAWTAVDTAAATAIAAAARKARGDDRGLHAADVCGPAREGHRRGERSGDLRMFPRDRITASEDPLVLQIATVAAGS